MPPELRQSTFIYCADSRHPRRSRKLASIEVSGLEKKIITNKDLIRIAPTFRPTFHAILDVMRRQSSKPSSKAKLIRPLVKPVRSFHVSTPRGHVPCQYRQPPHPPSIHSASTGISWKRAQNPTLSNRHQKRTRHALAPLSPPAEQTTPEQQTTVPANPDFTGESIETNGSGESGESKAEMTIPRLLHSFLDNTMAALSVEFTRCRFAEIMDKGWIGCCNYE